MKIRATLAIGATIAAAALFAACGGGTDAATSNQNPSKITTQHGLAVAAIYGNGASNVGGAGDKSASAAAPAANASTVSSGVGGDSVARSAAGVGSSSSSGIVAPQASGDGTNGITVSGFGLATADPDAAIIDFYFSRYGGYCCVSPQPAPNLPADGSTGSSGSAPPDLGIKPSPGGTVDPITEAVLQPVIDAIVGAGVARSDIQFVAQNYFDQYNSSATLHVTVKNITSVNNVVSAAQTAANNLGGNTSFSSNVSYTLQDCSAIEKAALDAAVTDAGERGQRLATALHVGLGKVIGASDNSYSPSGSQCSGGGVPYPVYYDASVKSSAPGGSNSVQVVAQISVTYAMN